MCDIPLLRCEACGKIITINEGPALKKLFGEEKPTGVILNNKALCLNCVKIIHMINKLEF